MADKQKYHDKSNEDREKEAREYIEGQDPVVREEPKVLNPDGGNVPEPDAKKEPKAPKAEPAPPARRR